MGRSIEPTIILPLSFNQLQHVLEKWPSFQRHRADLLQKYYLQSIDREKMRQIQDAYLKFCFLMEHYADLEARVPDKYLASFLSMAPTYLQQHQKGVLREESAALIGFTVF